MEKYAIGLADKEMYFLYINKPHKENTWRTPVNFGYYKINFFIEVDASIIIKDQRYVPKRYDFLSYPLYTAHYGILHGSQNVEYFEFLIPEGFFDPMGRDGKMREILEGITEKKCFSLPNAEQNAFVEKMYALRDLLRSGGHRVYALARVLELLFAIEGFSENKNTSRSLSRPLTEAISYMKEKPESVHTVKDVCAALKISRAYLTRLFCTEIGCTPYAYLQNLKLEYSLCLLKNGRNVTEACFEAGFNSCSVYIEAFKKRFATTPHRYMKNLKNA